MLDAVIIGGGITGLHAAWRLQTMGRQVRVVEARGRVGGRIAMSEVYPGIDLGATWVWPGEPLVQELLQELGIGTVPQHTAGAVIYDLHAGTQRALGTAGAGSLRAIGGAASIPQTMAARLDSGTVRLNWPASTLHRRADGSVEVGGAEGDVLVARRAIVALPPALAMWRLTFTPALPRAFTGLARRTPVWMGSIVKSVAIYREPFWRTAGLSGTAMSQVGPLQEIHDLSPVTGETQGESPLGALFGFTGLSHPDALPPEPGAILCQLGRIFGPRATDPLKVIVKDWSRDVDTSPPGSASLQEYGLFGHPALEEPFWDDTLAFASCETGGRDGHIEGALRAAVRAAKWAS